MSRILAGSLLLVVFTVPCLAQNPAGPATPGVVPGVASDVPPMPWSPGGDYDRYETPRQLVQRAAALKAAQRRDRIAAHKWAGYSPLRPPASPLPFMSGPSPWVLVRPPLRYPTVIIGRPAATIVLGSAEVPNAY